MFRCRLYWAVIVLIGLGGCGADRAALVSSGVPTTTFSSAKTDTLSHGIEVGDISGGSSVLNTMGITNGEFRQILSDSLARNGLLADKGQGTWQLDVKLSFGGSVAVIGDQTITADSRYILREKRTSAVSFDKVIKSSSTQKNRIRRLGGGLVSVYRKRRWTATPEGRLQWCCGAKLARFPF